MISMELRLVLRISPSSQAIFFCHRRLEDATNGLTESEAEFGIIHRDQTFISMQLNSTNVVDKSYSTLLAPSWGLRLEELGWFFDGVLRGRHCAHLSLGTFADLSDGGAIETRNQMTWTFSPLLENPSLITQSPQSPAHSPARRGGWRGGRSRSGIRRRTC